MVVVVLLTVIVVLITAGRDSIQLTLSALSAGALVAAVAFDAPVGFIAIQLGLAMVLVLTWVVWQFAVDFRDVFSDQSWKHIAYLFWRSFVRWTPLLALTVIVLFLADYRDKQLTSQVYKAQFRQEARVWNQPEPCPPEPGAAIFCQGGDGLQEDLKDTVSHFAETFQDRILDRFDRAASKFESTGDDASNAAEIILFTGPDAALPRSFEQFSGISVPRCRWYAVPFSSRARQDCGRRMVLRPLASTYENIRSELYSSFLDGSNTTQVATGQNIYEARKSLESLVSHKLDAYVHEANINIDRAFLASKISRILILSGLIFSLLKAFLYILARNVFDHRVGQIPLAVTRDRKSPNTLKALDITIDDDKSFKVSLDKTGWYGSFSYNIKPNRPGRFVIPQKGALLFTRLLLGKLVLQKYDVASDQEFSGYGNVDSRFIKIDLNQGDRVFFRVPSLVGFSEEVTLRRHYSLRLATILQFRLFFPVAEGPGSIVLSTKGGAAKIMPTDGVEGSEPLDLLAFDLDGVLHTDAQHGIFNTYFGRLTIFPNKETLLVRHSGVVRSSRSFKVLRKIGFFLLPF
ncbi:MAG: hypothetical protein ABJM43_05195 [Paracoccaceae bacterium]